MNIANTLNNNFKPTTLLEEVLGSLNTAVLLLDTNSRIQYINTAAEMMLQMSHRQAKGIPLSTLFSGEELLTSLKRVISTGQAIMEREVSLCIVGNDELMVDYSIQISGTDSNLLMLEVAQLDYQHRISQDERLNTQQQVVRGLAHEIKNPLGGLRGAAQLLEKQLDSDDLKEYTSIIIREADRLHNLLNRMMGPNQHPEKKETNIHRILQHVRQLVDIELDERLKFIIDYDPSIPDFYADYDQMIQIFLNIVRNAVQALNGAGVIILRTRIERSVIIENKFYKLSIRIEVEDNGPGIPESIQDSVFYPLVTGRADGTGLGLYLVQNLVRRNDGVISFTSHPGKTIFSTLFPLELERE